MRTPENRSENTASFQEKFRHKVAALVLPVVLSLGGCASTTLRPENLKGPCRDQQEQITEKLNDLRNPFVDSMIRQFARDELASRLQACGMTWPDIGVSPEEEINLYDNENHAPASPYASYKF